MYRAASMDPTHPTRTYTENNGNGYSITVALVATVIAICFSLAGVVLAWIVQMLRRQQIQQRELCADMRTVITCLKDAKIEWWGGGGGCPKPDGYYKLTDDCPRSSEVERIATKQHSREGIRAFR